MEIPDELKYLAPYIQRGQELNSREPIVAYYAHYYAVKLAISRGPSNKATQVYLSHLLDSLEVKKQALGADNETINDDLVGYAHVENFALKVFLSADNEDRSGQATKKTAKTFLAASVFLEILKTFGELDPEVEAKIKYSKWKAADIIKAIREGRVPTPGAPGEQENEAENDAQGDTVMIQPTSTTTGDVDTEETYSQPSLQPPPPAISDFPSPPSNFTAPLGTPSSPPGHQATNNVPRSPPPPPTVSASSTSHHVSPDSSNVPSPSQSFGIPHTTSTISAPPPPPTSSTPAVGPVQIAAAQKNAKWAISALNYDDIKTARIQLLGALNDLGFNAQNNYGY